MYASIDFQSKREFRTAVLSGAEVILYSPHLGMPAVNGPETVVGPWDCTDPKRGWFAHVVVRDMRVIAVH